MNGYDFSFDRMTGENRNWSTLEIEKTGSLSRDNFSDKTSAKALVHCMHRAILSSLPRRSWLFSTVSLFCLLFIQVRPFSSH